ncbi:hypothetical protein M440DRAFT_1405654 [Trichoderma longibrachiatum ATCC 18648]|uniref:Uncharacterized protein n=1 Tax=Trichoderma longibrachiatum ATCC 18648 TaxID=983965 RepID=A0A2T4BSH2_TRILO|nr:hypothetical protein M440DRAFT_1405654 [Trichoderma longibrachiatum ATCC 18648]
MSTALIQAPSSEHHDASPTTSHHALATVTRTMCSFRVSSSCTSLVFYALPTAPHRCIQYSPSRQPAGKTPLFIVNRNQKAPAQHQTTSQVHLLLTSKSPQPGPSMARLRRARILLLQFLLVNRSNNHKTRPLVCPSSPRAEARIQRGPSRLLVPSSSHGSWMFTIL